MPAIPCSAAIPEPLKSKIDSICIHHSQPQLIIEKRLTASDIHKEKLLIPSSQPSTPNFLTAAENRQLTAAATDNIIKFNDRTVVAMLVDPAMLADPSLKTCTVAMKLVNGGRDYLISGNWSLVLKRNRGVLFEDALVRLWCFRHSEELWLAVEAMPAEEKVEETVEVKEDIFMKAGRMAYEYLERRKEMEERYQWTLEVLKRHDDLSG